jgi:hypothetical protein
MPKGLQMGSSSKYACPVLSRTMKHALFASSIDQGGGKQRSDPWTGIR